MTRMAMSLVINHLRSLLVFEEEKKMTDRFNALTVVLDREIREDDAEFILNAIRMIKGVQHVEGIVPDNANDFAIEHRIRKQVFDSITETLYPKYKA